MIFHQSLKLVVFFVMLHIDLLRKSTEPVTPWCETRSVRFLLREIQALCGPTWHLGTAGSILLLRPSGNRTFCCSSWYIACMHVCKSLLFGKRCHSYLASKYCCLTEGKLSYVDQEAVLIVDPVTNLDIVICPGFRNNCGFRIRRSCLLDSALIVTTTITLN